ncbi:hypothetical protein QPT40_13235 [Citrobacter freundii]|uniref:hypothetical protein n=1 Tax=Citrobacter freundii TaxID=546 RepID=UPI0031D1E857
MKTNNHPAHGPVSLERLHQIREILSKAAAQSDGGNLGYVMADAVKVIDDLLAIPEALPCPIFLEPGLKFGKGVPTRLVLAALRRRDDYYAELEAMTPEQRAEHDSGIAEFKAMLQCAEPDFREIWNSSTNNFRENAETSTKCWCRTCRPVTMNDMRFVVCPDCGNKRCPHANDHRNACTGSNEPGQIGSAYPAAPQQEVKNG